MDCYLSHSVEITDAQGNVTSAHRLPGRMYITYIDERGIPHVQEFDGAERHSTVFVNGTLHVSIDSRCRATINNLNAK